MMTIHPLLTTLFWISVIYLLAEYMYKEYKNIKGKNNRLQERIGKVNPKLSTTIRNRAKHTTST